MNIEPTRQRCVCGRCHTEFTIVSAIGPSELCDTCAEPLLAILGTKLDKPDMPLYGSETVSERFKGQLGTTTPPGVC